MDDTSKNFYGGKNVKNVYVFHRYHIPKERKKLVDSMFPTSVESTVHVSQQYGECRNPTGNLRDLLWERVGGDNGTKKFFGQILEIAESWARPLNT